MANFYIGSADWMNRNLTGRVEAGDADRPTFTSQAALGPAADDVNRQAASLGHGRQRRLPPVNPGRASDGAGTHQALMSLASQEALISPEELRLLR